MWLMKKWQTMQELRGLAYPSWASLKLALGAHGWTIVRSSREICSESPSVRPVSAFGQILERISQGWEMEPWCTACRVARCMLPTQMGGRPYGSLAEPGAEWSVRGQREGGGGVPVEPDNGEGAVLAPVLHAGREGQSPRHSVSEWTGASSWRTSGQETPRHGVSRVIILILLQLRAVRKEDP